jgi:hypothetical protein
MNNAKRNWKTTIVGILVLALSGFSIYSDPSKATDPQTIAQIGGGIGLILAKDGDKTGTAQTPPATPGA